MPFKQHNKIKSFQIFFLVADFQLNIDIERSPSQIVNINILRNQILKNIYTNDINNLSDEECTTLFCKKYYFLSNHPIKMCANLNLKLYLFYFDKSGKKYSFLNR